MQRSERFSHRGVHGSVGLEGSVASCCWAMVLGLYTGPGLPTEALECNLAARPASSQRTEKTRSQHEGSILGTGTAGLLATNLAGRRARRHVALISM